MSQELTDERRQAEEEWWANMQRRQAFVDSIWNLDWETELKPIVFQYLDTQPERFLVGFYSGGGDSGGLDDIFYTHVDLAKEDADYGVDDINWMVRLSLDETPAADPAYRRKLIEEYGTSRPFEIKPYDFDLDDPENPLQYVSIATMIPQAKLHGSWADGGGYHARGAVIWDKVKRRCWLVETEEQTEYTRNEQEY